MNPQTLISTASTPETNSLVKQTFTTFDFSKESPVKALFIPKTADWSSDRIRITEIDRERFAAVKNEGQASIKRGISQGYSKEYVRKVISITKEITGEAEKNLTAQGLVQLVNTTAQDVVDRIDLDMRNVLGYAVQEAAGYTDMTGNDVNLKTGDGLAIFHAAHTLKNSPTTYSNIVSGAPALNAANLETAEDYFKYSVMDNNGQRIPMKPDTIITSKSTKMENIVARMLRSGTADTIGGTANANSGIYNVNQAKYKHLAIEFDVDSSNVSVSSTKFYWMLAALNGAEGDSLQWHYVSWMSPDVTPVTIKHDPWTMEYTARAAYSLGATSARGIVLSKWNGS